jgi:TetR/AcrR family transcriptional regulator, transcriptional repressor for nem operon
MARPREFDESRALEAAMQCFWRRGYEATSLRDLTVAMGLTPPSLYNSFGDKQQLFERALERYLDRTTRDRLHRLEATLAPRQALEQFFAEIIGHSVKDRQRKGCFLVNSALEIAPHDARCRAMIAAQFAGIESFFRRRIAAGQDDGTISKAIDPDDVARLFLGALLGIRVMARTNPHPEVLEGLARPALALLGKSQPSRKRKR